VHPAPLNDFEAQSAVYHDATSKVNGSGEDPQEMFTSGEVYAAMTSQDWGKLGHAESDIVAATDDRKKMNFRAVALLEHHLDRVIKKRDPNAGISLSTRIQLNKFVAAVSLSYNDAKFHSYSHAIHVTTSMNALLSFALTDDPLRSLSLVFSALLHDAGHTGEIALRNVLLLVHIVFGDEFITHPHSLFCTGMSNKILCDTGHHLCEKFQKDVPIAERNSIDIGLSILFRPEYQSLRDAIIPDEIDKIQFGRTLFQCILITDIASPENVNLSIRRFEVSQEVSHPLAADLCPIAHYISDIFDGMGLAEDVAVRYPEELVITRIGLKNCARNEHLMLLSDVAHLLQGWENFVKWNFRLCECEI
jgi:hypothetical protein